MVSEQVGKCDLIIFMNLDMQKTLDGVRPIDVFTYVLGQIESCFKGGSHLLWFAVSEFLHHRALFPLICCL